MNSICLVHVILAASSIWSSQSRHNKIDDPMYKIRPLNKRGSPVYQRFSQEAIEEAAEDNQRRNGQHSQQEPTRGSCSYTFIVPSGSVRPTSACAIEDQVNQTDSRGIEKLREEVTAVKSATEELRNEIAEERKLDVATIADMKQGIVQLKREMRNSDQRVSQLYMQLLHEIINRRDDTIEKLRIEEKLLNLTALHYALKIQYEQLRNDHVTLRKQLSDQSEEMKRLQQQLNLIDTKRNDDQVATNRTTNVSCEAKGEETDRLPTTNVELTADSFQDCTEIQQAGYQNSSVFALNLEGYSKTIRAWCDMRQDPGGWTVIQRRSGMRTNFNRSMRSYKRGFGGARSDYWLGLETLHRLTTRSSASYKLRIEMEDWNGGKRFAEYLSFRVGEESTGYKLHLAHFSGNAGDSLTWHNNMKFATYDNDNTGKCAMSHGGGWWYRNCARANLNGKYYRGYYSSPEQDGIYWMDWKGATYSLKHVTMKVRRLE